MEVPQRYVRNTPVLANEEALSLADRCVCVCGLGGLGGYVTELLARLGVGTLTVVDADVFEESNLNRQLLSSDAALGTQKATAAKARVGEINPQVACRACTERITEESAASIVAGSDCVIDALDNAESRAVLARACLELGIPLVYGSVAGWCGRLSTLLPGDCLPQEIYASTGYVAPSGAEGVLGFAVCVTASFQAAEATKVLLGKPCAAHGRLLVLDTLECAIRALPLGQKP